VPKKEFDHYYSFEEALMLVKSAGLPGLRGKKVIYVTPLFYGPTKEQVKLYLGSKLLGYICLIFSFYSLAFSST
jgi:hypothetical protein